MDRASMLDVLAGNAAFSAAPREALARLVEAGEPVDCAPDTDLLRQGDTGQPVWILESGEVEVLIHDEPVARIRIPGEVFGEIGAVSLTAATATVRAVGEVRAWRIPREELHRVIQAAPEFAECILRSLAKYLGRP